MRIFFFRLVENVFVSHQFEQSERIKGGFFTKVFIIIFLRGYNGHTNQQIGSSKDGGIM